MTIDVDTLETQVSEQLADLVQSLGNLKEQAENHGSSSKTLSETAAEIRQMISAITKTTGAIQDSADAVRKVDTTAVLQGLQETRSNLETALTTAAQRADTFQESQHAEIQTVVASVKTILRDTEAVKEGLSASVKSLEESMQSNAAFTVDKISESSRQLQKEVTDAIGQAKSHITHGQSKQVAAAKNSAAKHAEILEQLSPKLSHLEQKNSSQLREIVLAVEKTKEQMTEDLETRIGSTRTLVLTFGIISMLGIFATLGLVLFRG